MNKKKIILLVILICLGISVSIPVYADTITDPETGYKVQSISSNTDSDWNDVKSITDDYTIVDGGYWGGFLNASYKNDDGTYYSYTYSLFSPEIIKLNYHINKGDTIYFRLVLDYHEDNDGYQKYDFVINGIDRFASGDLEHGGSSKKTSDDTYYLDRYRSGSYVPSSSDASGYEYTSGAINSMEIKFGARGTLEDDWVFDYWKLQVRIVDNSAPSLNVSGLTLDEDTTKSNFSSIIETNDNEGVIGIKVSDLPDHGTLKHNGIDVNTTTNYTDYSKFSYLPNSNYNGSDSINFRAYDASGNYTEKTMNITINPVNDAPTVPGSISYSTDNIRPTDKRIISWGNSTDVEGNSITYKLEYYNGLSYTEIYSGSSTSYTHTIPTGTASNAKYRVRAYDNAAYSGYNEGNSFTVFNNTPPLIKADSVSTLENQSKDFDVIYSDTDADGDTIILKSIGAVSGGSASIVDGKIHFIPSNNITGNATVQYTITDGYDDVNGTLTITVIALYNVNFNSNGGTNVSAINNVEDNHKISAPNNPTKTGYTFVGWYKDNSLNSTWDFNTDTVTADITLYAKWNINQYTVAFNKNVGTSIVSDMPSNITQNYNSTVTVPTNTPSRSNYAFTGWNTQSDGSGASYTSGNTFSMPLEGLDLYAKWNAFPVVNNDSFSVNEGETLSLDVLNNDNDEENDSLTITIVSGPINGTAIVSSNKILYTHNGNETITDNITYKISDAYSYSSVATVTITVNTVNDAPTASNLSINTNENTSFSGMLIGSDVDSNTLTYSIVSNPTKGDIDLNANGAFTYTPNDYYSGLDSFTYKVNDGDLDSNIATVNINIKVLSGSIFGDITFNDGASSSIEDGTMTIEQTAIQGNVYLHLQVVDKVGNSYSETYGPIAYDILPPTVDIIPKANDLGGADVTIQAHDNWKLESLKYQISNDGGSNYGILIDYIDDISLDNIEGNNYVIKAVATDWQDNVREVTATVNSGNLFNDNEAPIVTFGTNGGTVAKSHYTTVNITDNIGGSGINTGILSYAFSTDGSNPPNSGYKPFLNGDTLSIDGVTGNYYLWVKVYDYAGNETIEKSNVFILDNTPPNITINASSSAAKNRTITANITDDYSVNTKYGMGNLDTIYFRNNGISFINNFNIDQNGTYTIYAVDEAGNEAVANYTESNLINSAPTISVDILGSDWTNDDVTISVTTQTPEGTEIDKVEYSVDNGNTWTMVTDNTIILSEEGEYTLKIKATDSLGNVSNILETKSYKIDKTAPNVDNTFDFSVNGNNIPQKSQSLVISDTYEEEEGDVVNLVYNWSTSNTVEPETWNSFMSGDTITINNQNGSYYLWAKINVIDKAGNTGEYVRVSNVFVLDNNPIEINIEGNPTEWTNSAEIIVTTNKETELKYKAGSFTTANFPADGIIITDNAFTINKNGVYTIYAKDGSGNQSVLTFNAYKLDNQSPTVSLSQTSAELTNENITVNFVATDEVNGSDIAKIEYQYSSDGAETWTNWINGDTYTFSTEGIYKLKAKTTDNAGNESEIITSGEYKIDKTIPSIIEFSTAIVNNDSITLRVIANDANISDLPYQFSKNGSYENASSNCEYTYYGLAANTKYDFKVRVSDIAGNYTESQEKTLYTLASQPTLSIESTSEDSVVLKITSGTNGIAPMYQVSFTDTNDTYQSLDWSRDKIFTLNNIKDGTTIYVKARNEDGVENEPVSITNVVLNKAPIININSNDNIYVKLGDTILISGTVSDTENGIVTVKSLINGIEKSVDVDTSSTNNWNLSWTVNDNIFDGIYKNISVSAKDNADNESIAIYTGTITVNRLRPNPQPFTDDVIEGIVYNTDKCVKIDTSGIEDGSIVKYSFDNTSWFNYADSGISITLEGKTTVYSKTIDLAGNESDTVSLNVWIDKTAPVVTNTYPNPAIDTNHWYNENTAVLMNFDDNWTNGIRNIEYTVTNSLELPNGYDNSTNKQPVTVTVGKYAYNYIHYKVTDLGGNTLIGYFGPYQVDQNPPDDFNINVSEHNTDGFIINALTTDDLTADNNINYYYSINDGDYIVMNPSNQLITGLNANTVYIVKVKAVDAAGNETISPITKIRTRALLNNDTVSLKILSETSDGLKLEILDSVNNGDSGVEYKIIVVNENSDLQNPVFEGEYSFELIRDLSNLVAGVRYDIYIIAKDIQNYETSFKELTIQKSAPPVITINNPSSVDAIYKKPGDSIEITGTVSDSDDESLIIVATIDGVQKRVEIDTTDIDTTKSQSFTLSWDINLLNINDKKYTNIEVKAIDSSGSIASGIYTGTYIVDTLGPDEPTITKNPSGEWSNEDVGITITSNGDQGGEPPIGIESYSYTIGNNAPITGEGTAIDIITITDEGETSVSTHFVDSLGNIGQIAALTVKIDRVNPVLSNAASSISWINQAITVDITAEDNLSGIDKIYYSVNKDNETPATYDQEVEVSAQKHTETIAINNNGAFYIHFKATDKAGNEALETYGPYQYDAEMPFIDFGMGVYASTRQSQSFIVTVSDEVSGIRSQLYTWSAERPDDDDHWTSFSNGDTLSIDYGNGTTKLWIKAEDEAGNFLVQGSTDVHLDNTPPTINLSKSTNGIATELDIIAQIADDNTGLDVVKWAEGTKSIEYFNSDGIELVYPYIIKVNKNEIYTVYVKDKAGNESINTITVNNVDRYNPQVEVSEDNHEFQNTDYDMILTYKDTEGLSKIAYEVTQSEARIENYNGYSEIIEGNINDKAITVTINQNGFNYIHYSVIDIAGKEITGCFGPYKFDNVKPVLSFEAGNDGTVYTEFITDQTSNYYDTNRDFIGYEVSDNLDVDISNKVVVDDSQINYEAIGTYKVSFNVTDSAGNIADTLTGNIVVRDTLAPYYLNAIDIETNEDQVYTFTKEVFTDSNNYIDSSALKEIIITDLPSNGTMKSNGALVSVNDKITLAEISKSYLTFEPDENFFGAVSFTIVPVDEYDNVDMEKANTINIMINSINDAPTFSSMNTFTGAVEYRAYTITYDELLAASNAKDIDNDELCFIITDVSSGILNKDNTPVNEDITQIRYGENIVWQSNENDNGLLDAFKVIVYDGDLKSSESVQVRIEVTPTYEVVFKDYDGTILQEEIVVEGASASTPIDPEREGYTFIGWNGEYDNVTTDLVIEAMYSINIYNIYFNTGENASKIDSLRLDYNSIISKPTDPTKRGYIFKGWYKTEEFTELWNFETDRVPAKDITLYSKWRKKSISDDNDDNSVEILINGVAENLGKANINTEDEKLVTIIVVDENKFEQKLENEANNSVITIQDINNSHAVVGELNGQLVKNMETKQDILEIKNEFASYKIPAKQINIDAVSKKIGDDVVLKDIKVQVEISNPTNDTVKVVENSLNKDELTIVAPPVEFNVRCTYENKTVEITSFDSYVERNILIPDGIDYDKITTGVVVDSDGTVRHVPTKIIIIDGRYYARINSLTNSTYSVIWNPKKFNDVENHWAKEAVNDMGSRLVIDGVGNAMYQPNRDITRAEFITIIIRTLGLKPNTENCKFNDVKSTDWYCGFVGTACEYGIISGYSDSEFGPNDKITREQAMTIISRVMEITQLQVNINVDDANDVMKVFRDKEKVSDWANEGVASCIKTGIVLGRSKESIDPNENITRAEVAVIVRRLLQKSGLI